MDSRPDPSALPRIRRAVEGAVEGGHLHGLDLEPVAVGVGLLGSVWRARLDWAPGVAGPASVIVKQVTTDPGNRRIVGWFGYDVREAGTYRHLVGRLPGVAPRAWLADDDLLVLDDLDGHGTPDQLAGADRTTALAVADVLGRVHAGSRGDRSLAGHPWLPGPTDPVVAGYGDMFDATWPMFVDRHTDRHAGWLTDEQRAVAERVRARFDEAIAHAATAPPTLVHGDARLDNVLVGPDGSAVLIDWQLAARGQGAYDLAFFVSGSLEPEVRRALGDDLLRRYHRALADAGVDVGAEQIEHDFRMGLVQNLPNPITAAVGVTPSTERGRRLLEINARRALTTLVDLGF